MAFRWRSSPGCRTPWSSGPRSCSPSLRRRTAYRRRGADRRSAAVRRDARVPRRRTRQRRHVVAALAALHPDEMSPRDALEALYALKLKASKQLALTRSAACAARATRPSSTPRGRKRERQRRRAAERHRGEMQDHHRGAETDQAQARLAMTAAVAGPPRRGCRMRIRLVSTIGNSAMHAASCAGRRASSASRQSRRACDHRGAQRHVVPAPRDNGTGACRSGAPAGGRARARPR